MLGLRWTVVSRVSWPRLLHADDDDSWRMSSLSSVITLADTLSRREASNENYQHASPQCRACNDRSLSDTDTHTHTHCDTGVNHWRVSRVHLRDRTDTMLPLQLHSTTETSDRNTDKCLLDVLVLDNSFSASCNATMCYR